MNTRIVWLAPLALIGFGAAWIGDTGRAQSATEADYLRAVTTIYAVSRVGGFVKDWCDARAPQSSTVTDRGLAAWRESFKLDEIESQFSAMMGQKRTQIDASLEEKREQTYKSLDQASRNPAKDCQGIEAYLNHEVNPQKLYPNEYALAVSRLAQSNAGMTPQPKPPTSGSGPKAQGTVYSVGQLSAIAVNARQAKRDVRRTLTALGTIYVEGTLEKYDPKSDVTFLNTVKDARRSRYSVTCYDLGFEKIYRNGVRALVLGGRFHDEYGGIVQLEDCQIVTDASALKPATVAEGAGLTRIKVETERVMTEPNKGLRASQIEGLVWDGQGENTIGGYQFVERTYLLLKDGWLYDHLSFTPMDLNVAASKRLEPQHWANWKRQGRGLLVQWRDENGRARGGWQRLWGSFKAPMKPGTRLSGFFQTGSAYTSGTALNGATSTSSTGYSFTADGRYRYSSNSMTTAQTSTGTGQDGSGGAVTTGTGGSSFGPGGASFVGTGSSDDEGTYMIDGYTLEFRSISGKRTRTFAYLWDEQKYKNHLVIGGVTYSPPEKK